MNKVPVNITEEEYMIWISDVRSMVFIITL